MLGELLLAPWRLRQLTWDELDSLLAGQDVRRQKDMVAFRLIALQVYNALAEKPLKPHEYLRLPAVDAAATHSPKPDAGWLERMRAKHGDKLEA